jgi:hypothetical protein
MMMMMMIVTSYVQKDKGFLSLVAETVMGSESRAFDGLPCPTHPDGQKVVNPGAVQTMRALF